MNNKKSIVIFIDWFYPGYLAGGPVQSIISLIQYLSDDYHFKVITSNCDLKSTQAYPGILPNTWINSSLNCEVYYADQEHTNSSNFIEILKGTNFDLVYINSFFSKNFSIIPLQILNKHFKNIPIVFAPRGMLSDGALAIKQIKKRLFLVYSKLSGLHSRVVWHATSKQEVIEIETNIHPNTPIHYISNLPKRIKNNANKTKETNRLKLFYFSRISEVKNLNFALSTLALIKHLPIEFKIYGPIEDNNYWQLCESLIRSMPQNIKVSYEGNLKPNEVESKLSSEQVLFLPTFNENFGHSIVESLLCGCPAIISNQTPWNDIEAYGAGFALDLSSQDKFMDAIELYAKMNQEEYRACSLRAINYISEKINVSEIVKKYKQLFDDSIENRSINI